MNGPFTTDGLIIKRFPSGDSDWIIHLLTPAKGRIAVKVKHSQSGKSPLCTISQLLTYGNYEISNSHDYLFLRAGSVRHSFFSLTSDLTAMSLASYLCDIASALSGEGENTLGGSIPNGAGEANDAADCGALLRMLLNSLYAIEHELAPLSIIKGVFELRAAAMSGFRPHLTTCARCGSVYPELCYLDVMNGSLLCADCKTELNRLGGRETTVKQEEMGERSILVPLSASGLAAVRCALTAPEKKLFSFVLTDKEEEIAFSRAAETYLLNHLEHGFDTLNFYHSTAD